MRAHSKGYAHLKEELMTVSNRESIPIRCNQLQTKSLYPELDREHTIVIMAFFQRNERYAETLRYFMMAGVWDSPTTDFVIIFNGDHDLVHIPSLPNINLPNVHVIERENTCFDFYTFGVDTCM